MHVQPLFAESRPAELHRLMRAHPLATLVVQDADGIDAHPLPIEVRAEEGRLRAHASRTHRIARQLADGGTVLAIFNGPDAYLSPRWFDSGSRSGRQAPSWNYATVHARGRATLHTDAAWLRTHLADLSAQQEAGRADLWHLDLAPEAYVTPLLGALVGIEIAIDSLQAKYFLSQQRTAADRARIAAELRRHPDDRAAALAALILAADTPS